MAGSVVHVDRRSASPAPVPPLGYPHAVDITPAPHGNEPGTPREGGPTVDGSVAGDSSPPRSAVERGEAGRSAAAEGARRRARREREVREAHPHLGGLLLALSEEPQHIAAWDQGAKGERALGSLLDRVAAARPDIHVLHDRSVPRSRANIDHLAITPGGVFVIDAKAHRGKLELRQGLFERTPRLLVAGRNQTGLVEAMAKQVAVVERALRGDGSAVPGSDAPVPVIPALCFVEADPPLLALVRKRPYVTRGVRITWPAALRVLLEAPGPLGPEATQACWARLGTALPPARGKAD